MSTIADLFNDLNPSRLLILGEPGSGKTVLAIELILQLLEKDRHRIPMRLSMAAWNPQKELDEWLTERLSIDYGMPLRTAQSLVELRPRRILPILDGLDEMDNQPANGAADWVPIRAMATLAKLNNYYDGSRDGPIVVTCRKNRYDQILQCGGRLKFAKTVEILPLRAAKIAEYIDRVLAENTGVHTEWLQVINRIRADDGHDLRTALSTPWILHLVISYAEAGGDPLDLIHAVRGGASQARAQARELLLDGYVTAVTHLANRRARFRHFLRGYSPKPEAVEHWMRSLARHLDWQRMHLPRTHTVPSGLSDVDIVPHLLWPIGGWTRVRVAHLAIGLLAPVLILSIVTPPWHWSTTVSKFLEGIYDGFGTRSTAGTLLGIGVLLLLACSLIFGVAKSCLSTWPAPTTFIRTRMAWNERLRVAVIHGLGSGLKWAMVSDLIAGSVLIVQISWGTTPLSGDGILRISLVVVIFLMIVGTTAGLIGATITAFIESFGIQEVEWNDSTGLTSSRAAIRAEFFRIPLIATIASIPGTLLVWRLTGAVWSPTETLRFWIGLFVVNLVGGLIIFAQAWMRYTLALIFTWRQGLLPFKLGRFLDWACEVGLLRTSGASYQFRHLELQRWLSAGASQFEHKRQLSARSESLGR